MLDFSHKSIVNPLTKYCKTFNVSEHCVDTKCYKVNVKFDTTGQLPSSTK